MKIEMLHIGSLRPLGRAVDGKGWVTNSVFAMMVDDKFLCVRKGTVTDLASVPRFARWFIDNDEPGIIAASVIHDSLYARTVIYSEDYDKAFADNLFYEIMINRGMPAFKAKMAYLAVRVFGKKYFKNQ